jgi:hypothetical protein
MFREKTLRRYPIFQHGKNKMHRTEPEPKFSDVQPATERGLPRAQQSFSIGIIAIACSGYHTLHSYSAVTFSFGTSYW